MIGRLFIYFKEMFPLQIHLPFALVMYFSLFFMTQALSVKDELHVNRAAIVGCFTFFGVMLLMRILDEFKDVETDRQLFPDRPLLRGAVKYSDIRSLGIFVFTIISILNLMIGGWIFLFYILMMIYTWLCFKWFFIEKISRPNLILTFITHQPLTLFVNAYVVATAIAGTPLTGLHTQISLAVLAYSLPIFAWETSRKIRAKGGETEYVTYSKLFGPRKACLLPLSGLLMYLVSLGILAYFCTFDHWFYWVLIFIGLGVIIVYSRFIQKPEKERLILKPVTEVTILAINLVLLIYLVSNMGFR